MPRYFFDFQDTGVSASDPEGTECKDLEEAKREAVVALLEMTAELPRGYVHRELTITVRDEDGRNLVQAVITFEVRVLD
ncbi:DUF6894 family protein [Mesorhizobium argentiipisi]|uniref:DUF6894 domain-containing protein n=1 Tax=Mesorhizobium argentiipisi TaxID=3015175 RepID=A0ABU8KLZ7_9HYPH